MDMYQADTIVVGAGLAGLVTTLELLEGGRSVLLIDRDKEDNLGGLANWAFGGMFFVDTKLQRRNRIKDSVSLALQDWKSFGEFEKNEVWGPRWAEQYVHLCTPHGYDWLRSMGLKFFPVLNWVERGLEQNGNSVPRFHMVWGTGRELVKVIKRQIFAHRDADRLQLLSGHRVTELLGDASGIDGVLGIQDKSQIPFQARADIVVAATGGINGSIQRIKNHWPASWGTPPKVILNGAHQYAVGDLHDATQSIGGNVVHLDRQWNYAAGIRHYSGRKSDHGLSLVPCKTALWLDYQGKRYDPPLITAYDTRHLVKTICQSEKKYSWQIFNERIAKKEFAISGAEFNPAIRDKKPLQFIKNTLLGNSKLVRHITESCEDVLIAPTLRELVEKMNSLTGTSDVSLEAVQQAVDQYDQSIMAGPPYDDEQQRRILHARQWRGDKARTCNMSTIRDPKGAPFMAVRNFILSRKSLGGIQTDLYNRVLTTPTTDGRQSLIPNLYAVGEAAGFGGGNMHGKRSLEGTFLGGCVLNGRVAGKHICGQQLNG